MRRTIEHGYRRLRAGRHSAPGQIYLLTTVTHGRRPLFLATERACVTARLAAEPGTWSSSRCLGWVLMPDHWHGLVELGADRTLADTMQRFKGLTAHAINRTCGSQGTVWEKGYHDRALRREEALAPTLHYLVANPIRAGLVGRVLDYPYWNTAYADDRDWLQGLDIRD